MNTDYYTILGVEKTVSDKDIKTAFRALAHKHHPDKGGDEKKFKEINEAYQTLSNKEKRAQYDRFGQSSANFGERGGFGDVQQGGFNMNYGDFARSTPGIKFTKQFFKKIPLIAWIFLIPLLIFIIVAGLVVIMVFLLFSVTRRLRRI